MAWRATAKSLLLLRLLLPWLLLVGLVLVVGVLTSSSAAAGPGRKAAPAASEVAELSADQAVRLAQQRHGGKALKVERAGASYVVRLLLSGGRVRQVTVDARSGAVSD